MIARAITILERINLVTDIQELANFKEYNGKLYEKIIKLKLNILNDTVGIVMAIPTKWKRNLIDFFIDDYNNFPFIPHVGEKGKVCLFDLEGVLIKHDFEALIIESISRLSKNIIEGIEGSNKVDFIDEFDSYWLLLHDIQLIESFVTLDESVKKLKYLTKLQKSKRELILSISDKEEFLEINGNKGTIKNGIYININSNEYIYPPDWRKKLDVSYINRLLEMCKFKYEKVKVLIEKVNRELLLFININQSNGVKTPIAMVIKAKNENLIKDNEWLQFDNECICIPLYINRSDSEYLISRGGIFDNIKDKKVLIVGCGSIGGYLISELIKSGITNVTLVDKDTLTAGNIYRHLLGLEYLKQYKTKAIHKYIQKNIPFIRVNTLEDNIEELIENYKLDFEEFDLIISATGNHNVNKWINYYAYKEKITPPIIYLWNEVLGIGNHALFIESKNNGCFECIIGEDENGLYDRSSYCKRGQVFTKKYRGCSSTFLPYGSIHSLKTVGLGIELSLKYLNGELKENVLISQKGDDTYMVKAGLLTSERYNKQSNDTWRLSGEKFVNKNCSICIIEEDI
ncbi:MAG: ThiF family adenylyltransferase [Sarcina sp.]